MIGPNEIVEETTYEEINFLAPVVARSVIMAAPPFAHQNITFIPASRPCAVVAPGE